MSHRLLASVALAALIGTAGSAQAAKVYKTDLLGSNEVPANVSTATGSGIAIVSGDALTIHETWTGLIGGPAAAAHIHCCTTPGTNTGVAIPFVGFPTATSGTYDHVFDLLDAATYTSAFLSGLGGGTAAGAEAALLAGLQAGQAYMNIHDAVFPGGEIRGFLTGVPEPASWALMIAGFGLVGAVLRRRVAVVA